MFGCDPAGPDGFQQEEAELMAAVVFKMSIDGAAGHGPRPGGGRLMSPWNLGLFGRTLVSRAEIRSRFV